MLLEAGSALLQFERWEDIDSITAALERTRVDDRLALCRLLLRCCEQCINDGDTGRAEAFLLQLLEEPGKEQFDLGRELRLARCVYRVRGDISHARTLLNGIAPPYVDPRKYELSARLGLRPF